MRYTNYWGGATAPGITPNSIPITEMLGLGRADDEHPYLAPGDFGYKVGVHDNLDFGPQAAPGTWAPTTTSSSGAAPAYYTV
jgi:hypothetical protein